MSKFCGHCGKPLNDDTRFCEHCGAAVASAPSGNSEPVMETSARNGAAVPCTPKRRNSWLVIALGVLSVIVLAWTYASPYMAINGLKRAALDGNTDALKEAVDFPALRASLKEELGGQISKRTLNEIKKDDNGFAVIGSALAGGLVNVMVDQLVTPQVIAGMVQGKKVDGTPDEFADVIDRFSTKPRATASDAEGRVDSGYESFGRFTVRIFPSKSKMAVRLVWLRSGLTGWRLSGIGLPDLEQLNHESETTTAATPKTEPATLRSSPSGASMERFTGKVENVDLSVGEISFERDEVNELRTCKFDSASAHKFSEVQEGQTLAVEGIHKFVTLREPTGEQTGLYQHVYERCTLQ